MQTFQRWPLTICQGATSDRTQPECGMPGFVTVAHRRQVDIFKCHLGRTDLPKLWQEMPQDPDPEMAHSSKHSHLLTAMSRRLKRASGRARRPLAAVQIRQLRNPNPCWARSRATSHKLARLHT